MNICKCGIAAIDCTYHKPGQVVPYRELTIALSQSAVDKLNERAMADAVKVAEWALRSSLSPLPLLGTPLGYCDACALPVFPDENACIRHDVRPVRSGIDNRIVGYTRPGQESYSHAKCPGAFGIWVEHASSCTKSVDLDGVYPCWRKDPQTKGVLRLGREDAKEFARVLTERHRGEFIFEVLSAPPP